MSGISYTTRLALVFTGIILTATLAAPAAQAQVVSADHALLNYVAPTLDFNRRVPLAADTSPTEDPNLITGESALLNQRPDRIEQRFDRPKGSRLANNDIVISGERALLGPREGVVP